MRAAGGQTHFVRVVVGTDSCLLRIKTRALDPAATSFHGAIQHSGKRLVNHAQHRFAIHRQANLNCKVAVALDETVGAVERVNHPHP